MKSAVITLLSTLIASYLPISNSLQITAGLVISGLLDKLVEIIAEFKIRSGYNKVSVSSDSDVYCIMEDYVIEKASGKIKTCNLRSESGRLRLRIAEKGVVLTDKGIEFIYIPGEVSAIELRSKTLDSLNISNYIRRIISASELKKAQTIVLYKLQKTSDKKSTDYHWIKTHVKTNKNIKNIVVTDATTASFIEPLEKFISSEHEYVRQGIPYNIGFVLNGRPGTGKSSLIKAMAVEYRLPTFCLDLSSLKPKDLSNVVGQIGYYSGGSKYLLVMEEIDKINHFQLHNHAIILLGLLDGVEEANGRITIMTSNNNQWLRDHVELVRPGRIDRIIELGYCTQDQWNRIIALYYNDSKDIPFAEKTTPAELIQRLRLVDNGQYSFNKVCASKGSAVPGRTRNPPDRKARLKKMLKVRKENLARLTKRSTPSTIRSLHLKKAQILVDIAEEEINELKKAKTGKLADKLEKRKAIVQKLATPQTEMDNLLLKKAKILCRISELQLEQNET